jgi:hypothetical protein
MGSLNSSALYARCKKRRKLRKIAEYAGDVFARKGAQGGKREMFVNFIIM